MNEKNKTNLKAVIQAMKEHRCISADVLQGTEMTTDDLRTMEDEIAIILNAWLHAPEEIQKLMYYESTGESENPHLGELEWQIGLQHYGPDGTEEKPYVYWFDEVVYGEIYRKGDSWAYRAYELSAPLDDSFDGDLSKLRTLVHQQDGFKTYGLADLHFSGWAEETYPEDAGWVVDEDEYYRKHGYGEE